MIGDFFNLSNIKVTLKLLNILCGLDQIVAMLERYDVHQSRRLDFLHEPWFYRFEHSLICVGVIKAKSIIELKFFAIN